jgi:transposase
MEKVLDVYKLPYDQNFPVVCMDESPKQLIKETRLAIPMKPGSEKKQDYEYSRCGTCNIFMANEPLLGIRYVEISERKTKKDWALFIKKIADEFYSKAFRINLIMDNLNTHSAGALYEVFSPDEARRLWGRFNFVYTPKHGSWLNMAEIELNVLQGQCLSRRIDNIEKVKHEVKAWADHRNKMDSVINWQFTTDDARIKLKRLYPSIET